jgi:hypothetical protein
MRDYSVNLWNLVVFFMLVLMTTGLRYAMLVFILRVFYVERQRFADM